jgi:hypothetical protein
VPNFSFDRRRNLLLLRPGPLNPVHPEQLTSGGLDVTNKANARLIRILILTTVVLAGTSAPLYAAQFQNPFKAAKEAWEKSRQQAKQQAEQQKQQKQQQQQQQQQSQPAATSQSSSAASGAPPAASSQSGTVVPAGAWVPPASNGNNTTTPEAPVKLDPAKLPDIVGLHLGMSAAEATIAVHKAYPVNIIQHFPFGPWPDGSNPNLGFTVLNAQNQSDVDMYLSFTAPPGPQLLWRVYREMRIPGPGIDRQVLLKDLRAKYGRESFATSSQQLVKDDAQIATLVWLYKEDGEQIPPSALTPFQVHDVFGCWGTSRPTPTPFMPYDRQFAADYPGFCSGIVALKININANITTNFVQFEMEDIPLAIRTADAASTFLANAAAQQRKEQLEKSKQVKPVL